MKWRGVPAYLLLMIAVSLSGQVISAAPVGRTVGIVDFYAPTPLGPFGFVPERFAATDLSELLTRVQAGQLSIVPRESMEQAEASLGWHSVDVLHFDRLRALAQAVGATTLVVGQIPLLVNLDGGRVPPNASANTNLLLQIFDVAQGQFVAETRQSAFVTVALRRDLLTKLVLHDALVRAVPPLVGALTAGTI